MADWKERREWLQFGVEILGLLGLFYYAYLTHGMLAEAHKSTKAAQDAAEAAKRAADAADQANVTTKESLVAVQRAFIFINKDYHLDAVRTDGKLMGLELTLQWENSGTTPARNCRQYIDWIILPRRISSDADLRDYQSKEVPCVLGPKGTFAVNTRQISEENWNSTRSGAHIYFFGWARYSDVFYKTPEHITRICYEFKPHQGTSWSISPAFGLQPCTVHNCYDEECKQ